MLENLVCSLETAKRLKAAGWNQPTEFHYGRVFLSEKDDPPIYHIFVGGEPNIYHEHDWFPAPLAEEALRELPPQIGHSIPRVYLTIKRVVCSEALAGKYGDWCLEYTGNEAIRPNHWTGHKSLTEAAAQMWLWCKENNHIADSGKKGE